MVLHKGIVTFTADRERIWSTHRSRDAANEGLLTELEAEWERAMSTESSAGENAAEAYVNELASRIRNIERQVITTPARSLSGLAVKVRFLSRAITLGPTADDEKMCQSTLSDLDDMMKSGCASSQA